MNKKLILASQSQSRQKILKLSGIIFSSINPEVDEDIIKTNMLEKGYNFQELAEKLAQEKALNISKNYPDSFVIGGDQVLTCEGKMFNKAASQDEAKKHLRFFMGKYHTLITSLSIAHQNEIIWTHTEKPTLKMKKFDEAYLDQYVKQIGNKITWSVGCYFIEENGKELFDEINGDDFSIMGLPLKALKEKLTEINLNR